MALRGVDFRCGFFSKTTGADIDYDANEGDIRDVFHPGFLG